MRRWREERKKRKKSHFPGVGQQPLFIPKLLFFHFYDQVLPFDTSVDLLSTTKYFENRLPAPRAPTPALELPFFFLLLFGPSNRDKLQMHLHGCCRGISPVSGVNGNVVLQLLETCSLPPSLIIRATLKKPLVNEIWNHSPTIPSHSTTTTPTHKKKKSSKDSCAILSSVGLGCAEVAVCIQAK